MHWYHLKRSSQGLMTIQSFWVVVFSFVPGQIDSFHIVISLSNRSSIGKSIKSFLKMKGQIAC